MATTDKDERWLFSKEAILNAPSTQEPDAMDHKKELHYRQLAANFIQEMGQKLQVYPFTLIYIEMFLLILRCQCLFFTMYILLPCT